ncbi:MAG: metallophosphoesterase [Thermoplasmata archaeon]
MKIIHISDTHIDGGSEFNREVLEKVLKEINSGKYDLLIHSGDVTQCGRLSEYQEAQNFFQKLEIPYVVVPGNHDARNGGIHLFEDYIGPSTGFNEFGDAVVIYVNSAIADSNNGRVGMVKFDFLEEALNEFNDKPIKVVVIHHHTLPIPMAGRERNILSNAGDLLDLFIKSDVDLVISGHRHYPNVYRVEDTVVINAGTVSSTKTRYGDLNSYNIIDIDEREKSVTTRRVDGREKRFDFPQKTKRVFSHFGKRECRIAHVSNTFLSDSRVFLTRHFKNAINTINNLDPDVVVHCGGIVREGIPRDYQVAQERLSRIYAPVVYTPAGRDLNYLGYHLFFKYFGKLDQTWSNDDIVLQGVSSSQYDSPIGVVGKTERTALLRDLEEHDEDFKGIFLHHSLIPIPHSREKGLLEDSGDLLSEVVNKGIDLVLTGTSSHPHCLRVENTIIVNANSLSSIYQRSQLGNSFNLIDIYEKVVAVYEINSLWGTKRLSGLWPRG